MYGNTIKRLMSENQFDSVYELATASGLAAAGLQNIISNKVKKPQRPTLEKLASVFDMTVIDLKATAKKEASN